jgi:hypothetical protein
MFKAALQLNEVSSAKLNVTQLVLPEFSIQSAILFKYSCFLFNIEQKIPATLHEGTDKVALII